MIYFVMACGAIAGAWWATVIGSGKLSKLDLGLAAIAFGGIGALTWPVSIISALVAMLWAAIYDELSNV